jgi:predicted Zn-dependent protease
MTNDDKKTPKSPFPHGRPPDRLHPAERISAQDFDEALDEALTAGDEEQILSILEAAPRWKRRLPEFMLAQATALYSLGDEQQALKVLQEISRKHPRFTAHYLGLAIYYIENQMPAHALDVARRFHPVQDADDEGRETVEEITAEATELIQGQAAEMNLPFDTMQQACILVERAQMAMYEDKLSEADSYCSQTLKIIPFWSPAQILRAKALFFSGNGEEAAAILEEVTGREPENTFALRSLVIYSISLNREEAAKAYARRMKQLIDTFPRDGMEIENAISVFALVEDTPTLMEAARNYLSASPDTLLPRSWLCLGVAAVRSGNWKEARKLLKKIDYEGLVPAEQDLLAELLEAASSRQPQLDWMPPAYPVADLFINAKVLAEWSQLVQKLARTANPALKRKIESFLQKHPSILAWLKYSLRHSSLHDVALGLLAVLELPQADAEIIRFAHSQSGTMKARLHAIMMLQQSGRYSGPKIIEIWNEKMGEWRAIEMNQQRIGEIEVKLGPQTLALIEKARKTKDPAAAISLLRKAVEQEPTSAMALFNLGVMLVQNGREAEGEELLHRSVEVDPEYTYGHASIALSEAHKGNDEKAREHLRLVAQAEVIAPDTAVMANLAWFLLALKDRDFESARNHIEIAAEVNPEHRLLDHYENMLEQAETLRNTADYFRNFQRQSAERSHKKLMKTPLSAEMNLRACLDTHTKEMLVGTAKIVAADTSGKKAELVSRLAAILRDRNIIKKILLVDLAEKEREALKWILEGGGVQPWKDFVVRYGSGEEEPVHWQYHEPQSIPGRLRRSGLFFTGLLEGEQVAFIPGEVRGILQELLG